MSYSHLLDLADDGSLARGHAYAAEGRVRIVSTGTSGVAAVAQGSTEYDVGLDRDGGTCTCPVGLRGQFCKHLVATVLVLDGDAVTEAHDVAAPPKLLMASAATGDLSLLRPAVDSLRVRGHLDWRRANGHGNKAHLVVDELEQVLSPATADAMLPLIERAIDHLIRAILRSDDSSGIQGDAVGRLLLLHEKAAGVGQPDPKKLVRWMVKVGFAEHGFFHVDPVPYADALGERGLAAYEKEVDKRLAANPGDFYPRLARQRLAVLARDIPTIVELVGGPLDRPYHFVQPWQPCRRSAPMTRRWTTRSAVSPHRRWRTRRFRCTTPPSGCFTSAASTTRPCGCDASSSTPSPRNLRTRRYVGLPARLGTGRPSGSPPSTCSWSATHAPGSRRCYRRTRPISPGTRRGAWSSTRPSRSCSCERGRRRTPRRSSRGTSS